MSTEQTAAIIRDNKKIGTRISPDYDHSMGLSTDTPVGRESIAFCVDHARGMLQGLGQ